MFGHLLKIVIRQYADVTRNPNRIHALNGKVNFINSFTLKGQDVCNVYVYVSHVTVGARDVSV